MPRKIISQDIMETYLTIPVLHQFNSINHLFGTRWIESPALAARSLGLSKESVVSVNQVHGNAIKFIETTSFKEGSTDGEYDALITNQPNVMVVVGTADCVPILMADPVRKVVAAVHAGWKGTLKGISVKVIEAMVERYQCSPNDIVVGLGPSAGSCCYEVDETVLGPLKKDFPSWTSVVQDHEDGKSFLDLRSLNTLQLVGTGIPGHHIESLPDCTICAGDRYYSLRRQGKKLKSMYSGIAFSPF